MLIELEPLVQVECQKVLARRLYPDDFEDLCQTVRMEIIASSAQIASSQTPGAYSRRLIQNVGRTWANRRKRLADREEPLTCETFGERPDDGQ